MVSQLPYNPLFWSSLIRRDKEVEPDTSGQHHIHGQPVKSRRTHFGELQINIHKLKLCQSNSNITIDD